MARTRTPTLRQQVANAERRRLRERLDARETTRRLLRNKITPRLERIRRKLADRPPGVEAVRDQIDALLGTIADEHARLDAADSVDRGRAAGLADDVEEHD